MKRKIINILFILSLFQVIGLIYFLIFGQIRIFDIDVITNPILLPLFFVGPMLAFFVAFSDSPGLFTSAIALFSPILFFVLFTILFLKNNYKQQIRKLVLPIFLLALSIFLITAFYELIGDVKFNIRNRKTMDLRNIQSQIFNQGLIVEYADILNFDDRGFSDSGKEYFVHRFLVTADVSVLSRLEKGTYQLCLRRTQSQNTNQNENKCLIRSKLLINDSEPQVMFDPTLETDYKFTYSLFEPALEVDDDQLTIALTGFRSSNQQQVAELVISRTERIPDEKGSIIDGGVITAIPVVGPVENLSVTTDQ